MNFSRLASAAATVAVTLLVAIAPSAHRAGSADQATTQNGSTVRIGVLRGGSYDVVSVPLEEYVARVLTGEALPNSPAAAMDALAIAVRTYTQANLGRHRAEGFDLCDQTHCQVMRAATGATDRAAQATKGQVLLYQGAPATIYYSASCGGRTEIPSAVWPGAEDPPYLPSRPDDGCGGDPPWTAELALPDLRRAFAAAGFQGTLRAISVGSRNGSGRVATLRLDGLTPSEISGQDLRVAVGRTLGWQHIRSAVFELRRIGDVYRMDGHGYGHGVGMCVIGSTKLAAAGESAVQILSRYYPGLEIGRFTPAARLTAALPAPAAPSPVMPPVAPASSSSRPPTPAAAVPAGLAVSLPVGDEGERTPLLTVLGRSRDSMAAALGIPAPPMLTVRVHATTGEYERATGLPWFTSGAVVNGQIHLIPLASLHSRGLLERTVRREVVRALADETLASRPEWVRVGAALYFADPDGTAASSTLPRTCPADPELLRPTTPGGLANAYAQARGCFARQLAGGRNWRDVR